MTTCLARTTANGEITCVPCSLTWDRDDPQPPECWRMPKTAQTYQVAGDHYLKLRIQPARFAVVNGWDACAFSTLKYLTRWADKAGVEDLKKARHFVDIRTELLPDLIAAPLPSIRMNRYITENELPKSYWPALLVLEELVQTPACLRDQTPDGLCSANRKVAEHLKSLIDDLIVAASAAALVAP